MCQVIRNRFLYWNKDLLPLCKLIYSHPEDPLSRHAGDRLGLPGKEQARQDAYLVTPLAA